MKKTIYSAPGDHPIMVGRYDSFHHEMVHFGAERIAEDRTHPEYDFVATYRVPQGVTLDYARKGGHISLMLEGADTDVSFFEQKILSCIDVARTITSALRTQCGDRASIERLADELVRRRPT